jgi:hypothetical protein
MRSRVAADDDPTPHAHRHDKTRAMANNTIEKVSAGACACAWNDGAGVLAFWRSALGRRRWKGVRVRRGVIRGMSCGLHTLIRGHGVEHAAEHFGNGILSAEQEGGGRHVVRTGQRRPLHRPLHKPADTAVDRQTGERRASGGHIADHIVERARRRADLLQNGRNQSEAGVRTCPRRARGREQTASLAARIVTD